MVSGVKLVAYWRVGMPLEVDLRDAKVSSQKLEPSRNQIRSNHDPLLTRLAGRGAP